MGKLLNNVIKDSDQKFESSFSDGKAEMFGKLVPCTWAGRDSIKSFMHERNIEIFKGIRFLIKKLKKTVTLEAEVYDPLDSNPAYIHGWNEALKALNRLIN